MLQNGTRPLDWLERWAFALFLGAGVLFVGHAAVRGIEAFTEMAPPPDFVGPAGYVLAMAGLVGLYSTLTDRNPRIAHLTVVVTAVPLLGWLGISLWGVSEVTGVAPPLVDVLPEYVIFVVFLATLLTYVLYAATCLRSRAHSRTLGLLLLVPAALFLLLMAGAAVLGGDPAVGGFLIGVGQALAHVSIGVTLHDGRVSTGIGTPASGLTTR